MKKLVFLLCFFFCHSYKNQIYKTFLVNGQERQALIFEPQIKSEKTPILFVFHGHGGNMNFAAKRINFQDYYKEAVVVFMQGLPGRKVPIIDPTGTKNGWQINPGEQENRDILFFDEVLKQLSNEGTIDKQKIFLVGHSNGARFVNVLWKERGEKITAIITVSAQGGMMIREAKPISVWMSMGKKDSIVPFKNQEMSIPIVENILHTDKNKAKTEDDITYYPGIKNTELAVEIRNEGHEFPQKSIVKMVEFLKRQKKQY